MINSKLLKARAVEKGLTQADVAIRCNVSVSTYNDWINNRRRITSESICKIAEALNLTEEDIISIFGLR